MDCFSSDKVNECLQITNNWTFYKAVCNLKDCSFILDNDICKCNTFKQIIVRFTRSIRTRNSLKQKLLLNFYRCGEHSDYGTITLLFQDSLGGLEVKGVEGKWINADPVPGAIVVNVGDLLESISGAVLSQTNARYWNNWFLKLLYNQN